MPSRKGSNPATKTERITLRNPALKLQKSSADSTDIPE
jgi:hypothetical protein